jgi:hypothetical protein
MFTFNKTLTVLSIKNLIKLLIFCTVALKMLLRHHNVDSSFIVYRIWEKH